MLSTLILLLTALVVCRSSRLPLSPRLPPMLLVLVLLPGCGLGRGVVPLSAVLVAFLFGVVVQSSALLKGPRVLLSSLLAGALAVLLFLAGCCGGEEPAAAVQDGGAPVQDGGAAVQDGGAAVQDGGAAVQDGGAAGGDLGCARRCRQSDPLLPGQCSVTVCKQAPGASEGCCP